ncbi:MAG: DNA repair protein RadA [Hyphomicrobiales bacterium]|nr:DNA repair protein RadA [Hyphomicrobiales bacterium]
MARHERIFVCQACGAVYGRWQGKCDACEGWNTVAEENAPRMAPVSGASSASPSHKSKGRPFQLEGLQGETAQAARTVSGIAELDRVTGGGFVRGSVLLVGGDPGIGKSTLLIQACASLARAGGRVVYISGEEATAQVRLRAERLGLVASSVALAAETNIEDIVATLSKGAAPQLVIIDSIQTMWSSLVESAPGTVTQVRACAQSLIRYAKSSGATVILVGHVTKDGAIAGPRVVEHMVDAVISFEGDGAHHFRILRASKNRFGPTDEIGVFEMTGAGLAEVANPSALFIAGRDQHAAGAAIFAGMEGTRPLLMEMQALVAPSALTTPRRAVVGWDSNRLAMVLAVLDARGGLKFGGYDIYLNVAGGLRILEPAADLAAAAILISSLTGTLIANDTVICGEVALSGAIRPVGQMAARLKEAAKLGFRRAIVPVAGLEGVPAGLSLESVATIGELVARLARGDDRSRER